MGSHSLVTLHAIGHTRDAEHHIVCLALNYCSIDALIMQNFTHIVQGAFIIIDGPRAIHNTSQGIGTVTLAVV